MRRQWCDLCKGLSEFVENRLDDGGLFGDIDGALADCQATVFPRCHQFANGQFRTADHRGLW